MQNSVLSHASPLLDRQLRHAISSTESRCAAAVNRVRTYDDTQPLSAETTLAKRQRSGCTEGTGTAHLAELCRLLDAFGLQRSRVQKQLHQGMIGSVIQRIFDGQSDAEMKLAMTRHKIGSCRQQFMAITPRRFGKTTAVAMFVSAFALAVPGTVTAIFSTGRRASNLLLQQIKNMLLCIPGTEAKIVSSNVETIVLQDGALQSKISSFPGKART